MYYSRPEKKILSYFNRLNPLWISEYPPDAGIEALIRSGMGEVSEKLETVIGTASCTLSKNLSGPGRLHKELALGNWQADRMREQLETDFAFQNTGGIRAPILEGDIKIRDIWALSPFGNHLVKTTLTGAQVRRLLEQSAAQEYSFLQVSGLSVVYNSALPAGKRVLNVIISDGEDGKKEMDDEEKYTVATNSFLAQGGDGYTVFTEGEETLETSVILRDLQIEYIKENSPVCAKVEGRLINVSAR